MYQSLSLVVQLAEPYLGLRAPSLAYLCSSTQTRIQPLEYRLQFDLPSVSLVCTFPLQTCCRRSENKANLFSAYIIVPCTIRTLMLMAPTLSVCGYTLSYCIPIPLLFCSITDVKMHWLKITGDILEITGNYWGFLSITAGYCRLFKNEGHVCGNS